MKNDERVDALNRGCQCITMDPDKLSHQLEGLVAGSYEQIREAMPNAFSTGPVFIGQVQVASIIEVIQALHGVGQNEGYRAAVLADAPATARITSGAKGVFFGYDFHLAPDGPKLIEINTNAGGAMLNLALGRAQAACCSPIEPLMKMAHDDRALEESIVAMFREEARAAGCPELRRIAIVDEDPPSQFLYPEMLLFAGLFERHGIETRILPPEALASDAGSLTHQGDPIDLVYNRLTDFYLETTKCAAIREAWETGRAVITPHPSAYALLADKRNLELLSDSDRLREFAVSEDAVDVLARAVPPTRRVRPRDADELWAQRKQLFFKPATGFGSRAAYAGRKITRFGTISSSIRLFDGTLFIIGGISKALLKTLSSGEWMKQVARDLTDPIDGFLRDAKYLIHDADPLFTEGCKAILKPADFPDGEGLIFVEIPPRSPNCNPHAERFVRSIKFECLRHFVFFSERHLRYVLKQYMSHYHEERFHQGIGGQLIRPAFGHDSTLTGEADHCVGDKASPHVGSEIKCRSRLGGLLNFYYREAA